MQQRRLGRTAVQLTELGLGGVFVREGQTDRQEGIRVVQRSLELGLNYIDTSPAYGNSQDVIGEALAGRPESVYLSTKCGRWDLQTGPYRQLDAYKEQWEESLRALRRDSVDLLFLHEADWAAYWTEGRSEQQHIHPDVNYDFSNAPVAEFLRWARGQGTACHLGISGNNAHLLARVLRDADLDIDVVLVAFQYDLVWRNAPAHLLPMAREMDVGVVLGAPLQQGKLASAREEWLLEPPDWMNADLKQRFGELYDIQRETGLSLPELAIRFLLADRDFCSVIPGAATVGELEENVRCASAGPLTPEIHQRLASLGAVFAGNRG